MAVTYTHYLPTVAVRTDESLFDLSEKRRKVRNPPPEKRAKTGSSSRANDKEPTWVLQKNKLVKVREFKGKVYIDIREFYEKNGELLPGKKGICLTPDLWRKLLSLGDEISETVSSLC